MLVLEKMNQWILILPFNDATADKFHMSFSYICK